MFDFRKKITEIFLQFADKSIGKLSNARTNTKKIVTEESFANGKVSLTRLRKAYTWSYEDELVRF